MKTPYQKTPYQLLLLNPRWLATSRRIMRRDGFKCTECGDSHLKLHVHHRYYVARRKPWKYPDFALATLCEECHQYAHRDPDQPQEWEKECGWVFGHPEHRAWPWDFAATMQMTVDSGMPRKSLWRLINDKLSERLEALRK